MSIIKYIRKIKNCSRLILSLFLQGYQGSFFIAGLLLGFLSCLPGGKPIFIERLR